MVFGGEGYIERIDKEEGWADIKRARQGAIEK